MSAPCPNWAPTPRTGTSLIRSVYREQLDERRSWFDGLVFLSHKAVLYSACLSLSSACLSLSSFKRCAIISSFTAKTALLALMLWLCLACARQSTRGLRAGPRAHVYVFRCFDSELAVEKPSPEREKSERL